MSFFNVSLEWSHKSCPVGWIEDRIQINPMKQFNAANFFFPFVFVRHAEWEHMAAPALWWDCEGEPNLAPTSFWMALLKMYYTEPNAAGHGLWPIQNSPVYWTQSNVRVKKKKGTQHYNALIWRKLKFFVLFLHDAAFLSLSEWLEEGGQFTLLSLSDFSSFSSLFVLFFLFCGESLWNKLFGGFICLVSADGPAQTLTLEFGSVQTRARTDFV